MDTILKFTGCAMPHVSFYNTRVYSPMVFPIPLWLIFVALIIIAIIGWKIIKFAVKVLIVLILIFGVAIVLDMLNILPRALS